MSSQYPEGVIAQIARSLEARRLPTRLKPVWRERSFRPCVIVYRRNDFLSPQYLVTVPLRTLCNPKLSSFYNCTKKISSEPSALHEYCINGICLCWRFERWYMARLFVELLSTFKINVNINNNYQKRNENQTTHRQIKPYHRFWTMSMHLEMFSILISFSSAYLSSLYGKFDT